MVEKSRTDRPASREAAAPAAQRPSAKPRETAASAYDSFWHCLSGRRPDEHWTRDRDVAPLRNLRAAFGLAEETRPIDYGPMARGGSSSPPAKLPSGQPPAEGDRPAGSSEKRGASPRTRRG
jgi:hypothetical protein